MTVWEEVKDNAGRYPLIFKNCRDLGKIHDWLHEHYQGYHFVIMLNEMNDEYEQFGKDTYVYFSNDALEEIKYYS